MEKFKASGLASASTAAPNRPSTEFDSVSMTLSMAQDVAARVEAVVDRLCGCSPKTGQEAGVSEAPDGVLARMAMQAHYTRSRLSDAMSALERIERALP